jgi:sulfate transport system permease protein
MEHEVGPAMSAAGPSTTARRRRKGSPLVAAALIGAMLVYILLMLILPIAVVIAEAFGRGVAVAAAAMVEPDAMAALWLTLLAVGIAVPCNILFGIAAAWTITKFDFRGKSVLITLIDLPFTVSPVIAGLILVLVFGVRGWFGSHLEAIGFPVIFAVPGIVLATIFVTFPFVARELIPVMQNQGRDHEEAAVSLGAGGFQVFRRVTLPNIRWGLAYGVILCTARAMGEFGAVSVVSGHIRGRTNTLPLHVEILYNEYRFAAAFAVAGLLMGLAVLLLTVKRIVEIRSGGEVGASARRVVRLASEDAALRGATPEWSAR